MQGRLQDKKVLIVTFNLGLAFPVVRILNKMGIKPYVFGPKKKHPEGQTPLYTSGCFCEKYIGFNRDKMGYDYSKTVSSFSALFVHELNAIYKQYAIDVLLPIDYTTILPLSSYYSVLDKHMKITPHLLDVTLRYLNDKWNFSRLCKHLEVPHPEAMLLEDTSQIDAIALNFPVVVKPLHNGGGVGVCKLETREQVLIHVSRHRIDLKTAPLLCQEFVAGKDLEVFVFAINGELKAWSMCYHAAGSRIFIEDLKLLEHCKKLLETLHYDGPGLIDIRHDTERDVYDFLEINVRFPASVMYHYMAGINYVALALRTGLGLNIDDEEMVAATIKVRRSLKDLFLCKANEYFLRFGRWKQKRPIE